MQSIIDYPEIKGKRVLVRVDWNVPVSDSGEVEDDFRIKASMPTIEYLLKAGVGQIILLTHLGNPVVRPGENLERTIVGNRRLRLAGVANYVADLLGNADGAKEVILENSTWPAYSLTEKIVLLENLRFSFGELKNDDAFAKELAQLGDIYVNEAFSEIHRVVASLVILPRLMPAFSGVRLQAEISELKKISDKPAKPLVFVLGGAKIYDKIMMIDHLLKKVDRFLIGGVMANTFLSAQGVDMKNSVVEKERLDIARDLLNQAPQKFILPLDFDWDRDRALDIGPQTAALFGRQMAKAETIFWNGPMGWTDSGRERFYHGSEAMARALAKSEGTTVVAGGDTLEVVNRYNLASKMGFCSTGGGATLAFLSGQVMPGIEALK